MLLALYKFGSQARGDADSLSDLDVLAVVQGVEQDTEAVELYVDPRETAISWYGVERLKQMFWDGDLFAWHLFLESSPILEDGFRLSSLGKPRPYHQAIPDIESFRSILGGITQALENAPHNAAYEFGILYVCVRNIGMSASWYLRERLDFSRRAPFNLGGQLPEPMWLEAYDLAMRCRMASQRGQQLPRLVTDREVRDACETATTWSARVEAAVRASAGND